MIDAECKYFIAECKMLHQKRFLTHTSSFMDHYVYICEVAVLFLCYCIRPFF